MARTRTCGAWGLLFALTLGVGAAPDQVRPPYRAEGLCRNDGTEYFQEDYGVCCARCPPGKYAAQQCTSDVNTVCQQCLPGTFTELWNYLSVCISCRFCDDRRGFEEDISCAPTKGTKCRCKPGMHCAFWVQDDCMHCSEHSKCPPGQEVATPGSPLSDTKCTPCYDGWFQDKTSPDARCQRHTDCLSQGIQVPGTSISDAVCSVIPVPETTTVSTDTKSEDWSFTSPLIILLVGFVISIILLVTVLLIRNPSIYKEIGILFRRGHQTANPHHQGSLERAPVSEPLLLHGPTVEVPTRNSETTRASFGLSDPGLKMVCENLQLEVPPDWLRGGPYMQETEPMSPSVGPGPQDSQEAVSDEKRCGEGPEQIPKNIPQTEDRSNGTSVSAGTNNGVHIEGKQVTINGNIYVFPKAMGPPSTPEGSGRPVQVTQDCDGMPTSIAEVGPLPTDQPTPFGRVAAAWHCVTPRQEEGKDMHLATPECMNEDACSGVQGRSPYIDEEVEVDLGRSLRLS